MSRPFQRDSRLKVPDRPVHTFITSWPQVAENANLLKAQLSPYGRVTMLDNPNHYFTEQWDSMLDQFVGEIVVWIMGDVTLPEDLTGLRTAMQHVMRRPDVGVYGPNIDYTFHRWDTSTFKQLLTNVYAVPCGEPNFWAIDRRVLKALHPVNPEDNYIGWGIDLQVSAQAELMGLETVRDYRFLVKHPKGTAYDSELAEVQMQEWVEKLNPMVRDIMLRRWEYGLKYNLAYREFEAQKKNDSQDHSGNDDHIHPDVP
jgi:hypothetical protein